MDKDIVLVSSFYGKVRNWAVKFGSFLSISSFIAIFADAHVPWRTATQVLVRLVPAAMQVGALASRPITDQQFFTIYYEAEISIDNGSRTCLRGIIRKEEGGATVPGRNSDTGMVLRHGQG